MWPELMNLGGMKVEVFGLGLGVIFLVGSFVIWRRKRLDFDEEDILSLWAWLAIAMWGGTRLSWWPSLAGAAAAVGVGAAVAALAWWCKKKKWNFWEWLDELGALGLALGAAAAVSWGPRGFATAAALAVFWLMTVIAGRWYRRWGWYESGRPGVAGLVAVWGWMTTQAVVAKGGGVWLYFGAWMTTALLVAVYIRSGRKASRDLANIWQRLPLQIKRKRKK